MTPNDSSGGTRRSSRCLDRIHEAGALVLVGGSGTGKSSLARAGLVPRLGPSTIITPGPDPHGVA